MTRRTILGLGGGALAAAATGVGTAKAQPQATRRRTLAPDIVGMDAVTLAAAIRARRLSCVEVMTAFLDHIERWNPGVNAIVALQPREALLAQAAERDAQAGRGEFLGLLHGFPTAVKDLQPVRGIISTRGSPIFRNFIPTADGLMVERLRRAGAIFIGKTNTPEFGLGSHTFNAVYGLTRNAYDPSRSAGGSSGGAAVALAMRMLPVADGSDFGGSLRNPAGWNNVLGFRTSVGRIAVGGDELWFPGMSVPGPMARNIPDLAMLLAVQAGHDDRAPTSMEADSLDLSGDLSADMRGKKIGWLGDFNGSTPCEPGLLDTCRTALRAFESLGCVVEDARVDIPMEPVWQAMLKLRAWQSGGGMLEFYNDPAKRALMKAEAVFEVESALRLSALDIRAASVTRTRWYNVVRQLFGRYDYLLAPTAQLFPFDASLDWPHEIAGTRMQTYHEWQKGNFFITMTGCPSLAVPAGFGTAGLPIGIQIVAPINRERACLQLGHAYLQAANWTGTRLPPQLARAA
ncbi:MAG TPA: amidase [Allosphingosinicella sp.]